MPFKSQAQRRFMYSQHPSIAKRWDHIYGVASMLPQHVPKKRKVRRKR